MTYRIKITVPVEIEVDVDAWARTYGQTTDEAYEDARAYLPASVAHAVHAHLSNRDTGERLVGRLADLVKEG